MSMALNQLLNERASVWESMKALRSDAEKNDDKAFTAEQRESWDKHEKRMGELSGDIDRLTEGQSEYDELEKQVRSVPSQQVSSESRDPEGSVRRGAVRRGVRDLRPSRHGSPRPEQRSLLGEGVRRRSER
jgi:HK97 family phage major capsid protein